MPSYSGPFTPVATIIPNTTTTTTTLVASYANLAVFNRIYVGSIYFELGEADLEAVFRPFGRIKNIALMIDPVQKRHRGYGFIEYETPDAAGLAVQAMDGAQLGGRSLKVGRPQNYPSDLPPGIPRPIPSRLYVASVHELVREEELEPVFAAFGPIRFCHLAPDPATAGGHKGYGYVEYEETPDALSAMASLNGFELAGLVLQVGKTVFGGDPPPGMSQREAVVAACGGGAAGGGGSVASQLTTKPRVPSAVLRAAQQINQSLAGLSPTLSPPKSSVMVLRNLEDYQTLLADPEMTRELQVDVEEECARFGPIKETRINLDPTHQLVKVFIVYEDPGSLPQAIRVMHQRWFGGRQITAESYDHQRWESGDLSG